MFAQKIGKATDNTIKYTTRIINMGGKISKVVQAANHVSKAPQQKINEVMPKNLWFNDANRIIWDDAFDCKRPDAEWLKKPFTFFGFPSSEKQIPALVCNAAPLNIVEDCIKKAYARGEKHLEDTLVKARALAIRNLDVDIRGYVDNNVKDAGMAETITLLGNKLFPHTFYDKLAANPVLFSETRQQTKDREESNIIAINNVFNTIERNNADVRDAINIYDVSDAINVYKEFVGNGDSNPLSQRKFLNIFVASNRCADNIDDAISIFKEFVRNSDSNPLNRLHLLHTALDLFFKKAQRLPSYLPHAPDKGEYFDRAANQFYSMVIEGILEKDLPPRIQQIIKTGANEAFNGYHSKKAKRVLNREDIQFNVSEGRSAAQFFKDYYETLKQHPTILSATHYEPYRSMDVAASTDKAPKM